MYSVKFEALILVFLRRTQIYSRAVTEAKTILLVEDEIESGEMLANFLELKDYSVLWAQEGKKALQLIEDRAHEIDLAILDIMVPNHDEKRFAGIFVSIRFSLIFLCFF